MFFSSSDILSPKPHILDKMGRVLRKDDLCMMFRLVSAYGHSGQNIQNSSGND